MCHSLLWRRLVEKSNMQRHSLDIPVCSWGMLDHLQLLLLPLSSHSHCVVFSFLFNLFLLCTHSWGLMRWACGELNESPLHLLAVILVTPAAVCPHNVLSHSSPSLSSHTTAATPVPPSLPLPPALSASLQSCCYCAAPAHHSTAMEIKWRWLNGANTGMLWRMQPGEAALPDPFPRAVDLRRWREDTAITQPCRSAHNRTNLATWLVEAPLFPELFICPCKRLWDHGCGGKQMVNL